jgi:hypothetical protein
MMVVIVGGFGVLEWRPLGRVSSWRLNFFMWDLTDLYTVLKLSNEFN